MNDLNLTPHLIDLAGMVQGMFGFCALSAKTRNDKERDVLGWIEGHTDELTRILQRLVAVPSVVGSEGDCQRVVAEMMRGVCDSVDVWEPDASWLSQHPAFFLKGEKYTGRPNVVGIVRGRGGGRSLILNAHVDVVDTGPLDAWRYPPWSGAVADGKLYGRGSVDDKAGLAAMIFVAQCLRRLGISPGGNLLLESAVDEEWGGGGTLATIHRGYVADAAIAFEPTVLEICPATRGVRRSASACPARGLTPIDPTKA